MLRETDKRLLAKFAYNCGWRGMRAVRRFKKQRGNGGGFPPFLFISITNNCNLRCQGCWVTVTDPPQKIDIETLDRVISECKAEGSYFFGLLGGEPLLHGGLFDVIARNRDCYFQVFTNGTLLTGEVAREMRRLGNVTPLVSIEGRREESDRRRGGSGVYVRSLEALASCRDNGLVTGVATSVCRLNIDELATREFVDELVERGVHYLWYYIYRPVGETPTVDLALSQEEIVRLRRFIVDIRTEAPIVVIDAYWDHMGRAVCPAAVGISHHISPSGDVEPCPPIQFAVENIHDGPRLSELLRGSEFLRGFRETATAATRGCILLERPDVLREFVAAGGARDTSGRSSGLEELAAMIPHPGHHIPGEEIPERAWFYRFAKKHWFFGFGAYG